MRQSSKYLRCTTKTGVNSGGVFLRDRLCRGGDIYVADDAFNGVFLNVCFDYTPGSRSQELLAALQAVGLRGRSTQSS